MASLLAVTLLAWVTLPSPATASLPAPGFEPKEWPANPAKHQIIVCREAADKQQSNMIAAAEATQPSKEVLRQAAETRDRNDPLGLAQPKEAKAPVGDKVWWYKDSGCQGQGAPHLRRRPDRGADPGDVMDPSQNHDGHDNRKAEAYMEVGNALDWAMAELLKNKP